VQTGDVSSQAGSRKEGTRVRVVRSRAERRARTGRAGGTCRRGGSVGFGKGPKLTNHSGKSEPQNVILRDMPEPQFRSPRRGEPSKIKGEPSEYAPGNRIQVRNLGNRGVLKDDNM